jgi:shikimate dehydrogenase
VALAGARVLLVGAGGAAAGVLGPLIEAGAAEVVVANRTADKAEALVRSHAAWAVQHGARLLAQPLASPGEAYDIVLNASSSSLAGAAVPVPASVLRPGALAVDLMYGSAAAPFMAWARAHGAVPRDGLGMLVEQAAEAFYLWRGVMPATAPVLDALRSEIDAELGAAA